MKLILYFLVFLIKIYLIILYIIKYMWSYLNGPGFAQFWLMLLFISGKKRFPY
ncbi:hypothetical protein STK_20014 [Sulfurisphaera tokodaii str. 7]|uniref:Uncharacterized protein n=1 Tax=Sulfurisphaera tokodaii (strain DSM 16993 / JCM 10545 / NBRC 100140 / 7) TaxID=273063 RepID=Q96Z29_SULTO|nr:hypothetical protein STK_20014 [Sulfurisphaera tokodaii str. 7]